jgi:hypothetical protein
MLALQGKGTLMKLLISLIAIALIITSSAWAACRTSHDRIGAGITWTDCDNGYRAEEHRNRIGGSSFGSDNRGHRWRRDESAITGDVTTEEEQGRR